MNTQIKGSTSEGVTNDTSLCDTELEKRKSHVKIIKLRPLENDIRDCRFVKTFFTQPSNNIKDKER